MIVIHLDLQCVDSFVDKTTRVTNQLTSIVFDRSPQTEILTDDDTALICGHFRKSLRPEESSFGFDVLILRPGMVERGHRTIAARKQCFIPEAVYWHNVTPKDNFLISTAPADKLHKYHVHVWGIDASA